MTVVHINQGVNVQYAARVRKPHARKWTLVSELSPSRDTAFVKLSEHFVSEQWARGEVIMIADYYDPVPIVEMRR